MDLSKYKSECDELGITVEELARFVEETKKNVSIETAIHEYKKHLQEQCLQKEITEGTLESYCAVLNNILDYLVLVHKQNIRINQLNIELYDQYAEYRSVQLGKKLSANTYNKGMYVLSALITFAFDKGLMSHYIKLDNWQKIDFDEPKYLFPSEVNKIISEARLGRNELRNTTIIMLLLYTGCTLKELLSVKRKDLDLRKNTLFILENGARKSRVIPLHNDLEEILGIYMPFQVSEPDDLLFFDHKRRPLKIDSVQVCIKNILRDAGLSDHSSKSFRDTYAVNSLYQGTTLEELVSLLGLDDAQRASRYMLFLDKYRNKITEERERIEKTSFR